MKLKIDFSRLESIRKRMGAPLKDFRLIFPPWDENFEKKLVEGEVEIDATDIEVVGSLLSCKNIQVILYIKDTMQTLKHIKEKKHKAKKFHIAWCKTLEQKKRDGSFERYVVTKRTNGKFKVDVWIDEEKSKKIESEEELYVCQYCLEHIDYEDFSMLSYYTERRIAVEKFNIKEFLDEYGGIFKYLSLPSGEDITEPLAEYNIKFVRRARIVKEKAKYCCKECGVNLKNAKRMLHCHHINHKKHDNRWKNLMAICALCHKENHHRHMYVSEEDTREIKNLRKEQKIEPSHLKTYSYQ